MRRIRNVARVTLVLSIVSVMSINTANACRLFRLLQTHRGAATLSAAQCAGIQMTGGETIVSPSIVMSPSVVSYDAVVSTPIYGESIISDSMVVGESYSTVSSVSSAVCGCCDGGSVVSDGAVGGAYHDGSMESVVVGSDSIVEGVPVDAAPIELAPTESSVIAPSTTTETPSLVRPTTPDPMPNPAEPTTADPSSADRTPATTNNDDDLGLGGAEEPMPNQPAGDELPGNTPADTTPPETDPAPTTEPAGDGDLFGPGDATETPAGDTSDDLFSPGTGASNEPATDGPRVATNPDPADTVAPSAAPADDLFAPTTDTAEPATDAGTADDLFESSSLPRGNGMRVWTDDTGHYQTVGRLVVIARTHVRLIKENGRYSTVPLNRLSEMDVAYVMGIAKKLSTGVDRIASR